jgi:hypothetical protein
MKATRAESAEGGARRFHLISCFRLKYSCNQLWYLFLSTGPKAGADFAKPYAPTGTHVKNISFSLDLPNLLAKEVSAWNRKAFTASSPPSY